MPNVNAPRGLIPVGTLNHGAYRGKIRTFLATGATGAIYIGSPVGPGGDSGLFNGQRYTTVTGAYAAGSVIRGVCVGVLPVDRSSTTFRATSTNRLILVDVDPYTIFEVQDSQATDANAVLSTEMDMVASLTADGGSTVTGYSTIALDGNTASATLGTTDAEILDIIQDPTSIIGGYCRYHVRLLRYTSSSPSDTFVGTA